jgi:glutathione synthase/RimK-type ligase-like ATP-grasp enzyme
VVGNECVAAIYRSLSTDHEYRSGGKATNCPLTNELKDLRRAATRRRRRCRRHF